MFTIASKLDEIMDDEDNGFIEVVIYLSGIPLWKIFCFYFLTFILRWDKGKTYRMCLKCLMFPYYLRFQLFLKKFKCKEWGERWQRKRNQ